MHASPQTCCRNGDFRAAHRLPSENDFEIELLDNLPTAETEQHNYARPTLVIDMLEFSLTSEQKVCQSRVGENLALDPWNKMALDP